MTECFHAVGKCENLIMELNIFASSVMALCGTFLRA